MRGRDSPPPPFDSADECATPPSDPPEDPFRELDEEFDEMCRQLQEHGVDPEDVQPLAREILVHTWQLRGDRETSGPLDGIAALVAGEYLEGKRHPRRPR